MRRMNLEKNFLTFFPISFFHIKKFVTRLLLIFHTYFYSERRKGSDILKISLCSFALINEINFSRAQLKCSWLPSWLEKTYLWIISRNVYKNKQLAKVDCSDDTTAREMTVSGEHRAKQVCLDEWRKADIEKQTANQRWWIVQNNERS